MVFLSERLDEIRRECEGFEPSSHECDFANHLLSVIKQARHE